MSGLPFEPVHGSWVTAAEMIFDEPSAVRSDWKNDRRFAASAEECGLPAPDSLGYSCPHAASALALAHRNSKRKTATCPVNVNALFGFAHVSYDMRRSRAKRTHRRGCTCSPR